MRRAPSVMLGTVMLVVATAPAPRAAWPLLAPALLALVVSLTGRWPTSGTFCAVAAAGLTVTAVLTGHEDVPLATADGVLITAYLLVLDRVETTPAPLRPWSRSHAPALLAAVAAGGVVYAVAALPVPAGPAAAVTGAAAAVAAYWYALHPD